MRPLNKTISRLLDTLTADLDDPAGEGVSNRKYDNAPDTFMPLVVERIGENRYSVAHYFEQNGDLVPDPDLEVIHSDGKWYPAACTFATGHYSRVITECDSDGRPTRYSPRAYASLRSFATTMLTNVKHQQGIKVPRAPRGGGGGATKPEVPVEGTIVGSLQIGRREFTVERLMPGETDTKLDMDRPMYMLRGKRGAVYATFRNRPNPDHMFLCDARGFGIARGCKGVWLTDKDGTLRVL